MPPGAHGAGDALHFGLALLDASAPSLALGSPPAPDLLLDAPTGIGRLRRDRGMVLARGPPPPTPSPNDTRS